MLAVTPPLALADIPSSCKLIAFDLDGTVVRDSLSKFHIDCDTLPSLIPAFLFLHTSPSALLRCVMQWNPDLYELWGGGSPFKVVDPFRELRDRSNRKLVLCGEGFVGRILHHVKASGVKVWAWLCFSFSLVPMVYGLRRPSIHQVIIPITLFR
jgi:hypothetical protein